MEDEITLIRKIRRTGSRAAADQLVRKYFDEIYRYVFRQTSDKQTAMNLTQNIFISMLQTIGNYDAKKASFRTWLYRIATNKTIDYFRSRATEKQHVISVEELDVPDETEFTRQIEMKALLTGVQRYIEAGIAASGAAQGGYGRRGRRVRRVRYRAHRGKVYRRRRGHGLLRRGDAGQVCGAAGSCVALSLYFVRREKRVDVTA